MLDRRRVLTLGGLAIGGVVGGSFAVGQEGGTALPFAVAENGHSSHLGHNPGVASSAPSPSVPPFSMRLPIPRVLRPIQWRRDADIYQLTLRHRRIEMLPGMLSPTFTYGDGFVGPTIRARTGRPVIVKVTNRLDRAANTHLHGGHVPPDSDGHPMDLVESGRTRTYHYPNDQAGATLWYHDHTHHLEAEHVYRGLHGFYLLEGADEARLGLPSGEFDIPIMFSDAHFDQRGALIYAAEDTPNRDTLLANGRPQPYLPVLARKYRFRLLDASNFHTYRLSLGGDEMVQIASDGGLLPAPVPRTDIVLSPGERAEIVIDFARYRVGSQVVLSDPRGPVLRFDVRGRAHDRSRVPDELRPLPPLVARPTDRDVVMSVDMDRQMAMIDGKMFDPNRIDARIRRGSTEIWRISNTDAAIGLDHNMHIHLVQFRVLDRDGAPPVPGESGLKDTVFVPAGTSVRVEATFADYRGRYVYHCHMLEHSSGGMMAQLEIVD
jgi:FtsP/CotA-like multicopper oxidase with cupredoxin domain